MTGRYAPSPTGKLHLGNAATALWAWAQVRKAGGQFILRMDDLDEQRSKGEYVEQQLDDLRWLGIDWDHGPDSGGPSAPYFQQQRKAGYGEAFDKLNALNLVYPCFCSRKDLLHAASAPHGIEQEGPVYPSTCRGLSAHEVRSKSKEKDPAFRFKLPQVPRRFVDLVMGEQNVAAGFGGDFILRRADGLFAYQLATVVDDAAMGITHVSRGADLLNSTPWQLALYEALGLEPPTFSHFPLWQGKDGARLAKRHGAIAIADWRRAGKSAAELRGRLAHGAGLLPSYQPLKAEEVVQAFETSSMHVANIFWEDFIPPLL